MISKKEREEREVELGPPARKRSGRSWRQVIKALGGGEGKHGDSGMQVGSE
jgi:hypothetical protein